MATYQYTARSAGGEQVVGTIQADNEAAVARSLGEQQLYPIAVKEQAPASAVQATRRVRLRDQAMFYQQLADLLRASVPLLRCLDTLRKTVANKKLADILNDVHQQVGEGRTFAEALEDHPETFPPLQAAMVRAGETAGFLEDVCQNLGEFLDRQDDLRSKVRGAMIYPIMLTGIGLAVIVVALVWLVPMFRPAFAQMRLPLATEILFGVSSALLEHHWMVLGVLAVLVGAGISYFRSEAGRLQWDRLKLNMPVVGAVLRAVSISRFCRILGTMLANGVPMIRALEISKAAAGNLPLQNAVGKAARAVESGQPLIQPLRESGLFSPEVIEMIAVAEESNNLERALLQIAETTERRTNRKVDQVVRLIEPLILVVIAGVIGFVAAGLLYPIFTMSRTLGR